MIVFENAPLQNSLLYLSQADIFGLPLLVGVI